MDSPNELLPHDCNHKIVVADVVSVYTHPITTSTSKLERPFYAGVAMWWIILEDPAGDRMG